MTEEIHFERAIAELKGLLGSAVSTEPSALEAHSQDESHHRPFFPDAVVTVRSVDEISITLRTCSGHGVPVTPFGAGTGLEGGAIPVRGGVALDLSQMNRILRVGAEDLDVTVEPGVTLSQLNQRLGGEGLFFPVDPGSDPTLGGMVATGASGTNAVRYGTMKENILGLTVVLADGEVVRTGGRARKSAAGYDLTHLFVGSEGTLAVVASATLRVWGLPEETAAAVCGLQDLHQTVTAVIEMIQLGIPLARIELLDDVMIDAVNRASDLEYKVCPTLMLEFHGSRGAIEGQVAEASSIIQQHGGQIEWTASPTERNRLWRARHHALYAAKALRPGASTWATDVCVPISSLAECIDEAKDDIQRSGLVAPIVGHVGDGNFHLTLVVFPDDVEEMARASGVHERMVARALAAGGTCTGEHGIGLGKMGFLVDEHGNGVAVMRRLKEALDPRGILNPGKIFPTGAGALRS